MRDSHYSKIKLTVVSEQLTKDLLSIGKKIDVAVSRAIKKTERWLRTHSSREIGAELNITQKAIKHRYKIDQRGSEISLWFGLLNVAAHDVGKPSQNKSGVRVRGRQYTSAFYRSVYGVQEKVYIRAKRNMRLSYETYTADGKHRKNRSDTASGFMVDKGGRFPLQVLGVEIGATALRVLKQYEARINVRYEEILAQEVNYILISA